MLRGAEKVKNELFISSSLGAGSAGAAGLDLIVLLFLIGFEVNGDFFLGGLLDNHVLGLDVEKVKDNVFSTHGDRVGTQSRRLRFQICQGFKWSINGEFCAFLGAWSAWHALGSSNAS
jgi:hypothetical protein